MEKNEGEAVAMKGEGKSNHRYYAAENDSHCCSGTISVSVSSMSYGKANVIPQLLDVRAGSLAERTQKRRGTLTRLSPA